MAETGTAPGNCRPWEAMKQHEAMSRLQNGGALCGEVGEDVSSHAAGVLGERVLTGEDNGPCDGREVGDARSGEGVGQCRRALGNMGLRTALPEEVVEGVVRPWWHGERRGDARGGDWWRLRLRGGGLGSESLGVGARWEGRELSVAMGGC